MAASTAACKTRTQKNKGEAVVAEGWYSLYETALYGIEQEVGKHDEQRDQMVEKLQSIVADVKDENNGQVSMMERHSADIIAESKEMMQSKYEARSKLREREIAAVSKAIEILSGDDAHDTRASLLELSIK